MRGLGAPVLEHLTAEREWYDVATGHLGPLVQELRAEMTGRVPATDSSVSWTQHGYSYYTVLPEGREYAVLSRRRDTADAPAEVLLDLNELVGDGDYVELGLWLVSPSTDLLAYSVDFDGDEVHELRFRSLSSDSDLPDVVPATAYGGAWAADSSAFYYTTHDEQWRQHRVWRHVLGTPASEDVVVLEEPDQRFELDVHASRCGDLVVITSESRDTSEAWVLSASDPSAAPRSVGSRRAGVEYRVEPLSSGSLLLVTNDSAPEFRLVSCPVPGPSGQDWTAWSEVRPSDPAERLSSCAAFSTHVVLTSRVDGAQQLRILPVSALSSPGVVVSALSPVHSLDAPASRNLEMSADSVLVVDEAYLQPPVWSTVSFASGLRTEVFREPAPGFDPAAYVGERLTFPAPDGTPIPATVLRHRSVALDGTAPCLLYAYGAYESVFPDQEWDPAIPSLLDRGVVYVHTHVRGGGEGGRRWWLSGRLSKKQNTFTDHLAVADGLASSGLVDGTRLATRGLSAGGLLQGAVFSQRPSRWRAVVAEVPFVDVLTTMLDPTIPLTVNEWDEWGDPSRLPDYEWMAAYSPYDNLPPAGARPDLLVTGALHDARVMVWEPAKWVAALRHSDPDWAPRCLFRVETGAGAHVGPAGRYAHLAYEAEVYAWILDRLA